MPSSALSYQLTNPEITGLEGQLKQNQADLEKHLAPIREERQQATTDLQAEIGKPLPEAPKLEQVPKFQPRQISGEELTNFSALSTAIAALASLATRAPLTSALNSAGAAMESFHKGALDQANLDIKNFKTQADAAVARNNQALQEYNAVLKNRTLSMNQKMSMLRVIASKEQDEIALAQLKSGDLRAMLQLQEKRLDGFNKWNQFRAQFEQKIGDLAERVRHNKEMEALRGKMTGGAGGDSGLSPLGIQYLSAFVQLNGRMPIGMSRNNPAAWAVMNNLAEEAQAAGMSPQDWAAAGPLTQQKLGAYGQLYKMRNAVESFGEMLKLNGSILKKLSEKVDRSGSPYVNRSVLWLKQNAVNDPDVSEYLAQVEIFLPEVARVLNNPNLAGQLTDSAREEMRLAITGALPPKALAQVIDRVSSDADNRLGTLDAQLEKIKHEIRNPMEAIGGGGPKDELKDAATKAWGSYEPQTYEYRIVNGTIQRRRKGG